MTLQKFISRTLVRGLRFAGRMPWFGDAIVRASFDAVRQTWGERSWMFETLQDAWLEIDHCTRRELQRIHGGLIKNAAIVQKIRSLFLQFSVGPSGLICTPNASHWEGPENSPEEKTAVEAWNHEYAENWAAWYRAPELNSEISGGQLTRLWAGLLFDTGEIFVYLLKAPAGRGVSRGTVPRLQTIDSHRCETPTGQREYQGNVIVDGIELAPDGRRVAAWFKKTNYDTLLTGGIQGAELFDRIEFFDANGQRQLLHKFKVRRPGQVRGIPEGFSVYNLIRDNLDLHKLEMQAAKLASNIANVETNPSGELSTRANRQIGMKIQSRTLAGDQVNKTVPMDYKVSIGSSTIGLRSGDKLEQFMISRPTVATQDYWDLHYTLICMGYNVPKLLVMPYSLQGTVTRADLDVSGFGFGRENYEIVAELLREIYEWRTVWAVQYDRSLDGPAPEDYAAVVIRPPRAPNVDIGYTAKALETELKLGVKTMPDVYAEKQQNWRTATREIAEYIAFVQQTAKEFNIDPGQISELALATTAGQPGTAEKAGKSGTEHDGEEDPASPESAARKVIYS